VVTANTQLIALDSIMAKLAEITQTSAGDAPPTGYVGKRKNRPGAMPDTNPWYA